MADSFLLELNEQVNLFVEERDWDVFQTPKNLSMALIVEAAELVEHFQWMRPEESDSLTNDKRKRSLRNWLTFLSILCVWPIDSA